MGKAKHTRISQRMSQHIMWLKLSLGILASKEITYQDDMFIAHEDPLVNTFLSAEALAWIFAVAGLQIVQDLLDPPCARHKAGDKTVADRQKKEADHGGSVEKAHAAL